jgi:hypothetical protein
LQLDFAVVPGRALRKRTQKGETPLEMGNRLEVSQSRCGMPPRLQTTFAIGWKGRYRLEGLAFVYSDRDTGRVTTILGYPTERLIETE